MQRLATENNKVGPLTYPEGPFGDRRTKTDRRSSFGILSDNMERRDPMARRRMGDSDFADRIDESRRLLVAFVQEMEKPYKMVHSVLGNTISGEPKVVIEAVRTAELLPTNMVVNANQADPVERLRRLHVDSANKIVKAYAVVAAQRKLIGKDETIVDVHDRDKHLVEKTEKHQKEMLRLREEGKLKAHDALYRSAKLQKDEKVHKKGPSAFGRLKNLFRTKNDIVKDF